ncbi:MAG: hypothetical protein LBJ88_04195 [Campylobacteraceae bacterium]|jgi:hypothetical protein|nr:hypothetical protein [Campylobacteraceae bacterium]
MSETKYFNCLHVRGINYNIPLHVRTFDSFISFLYVRVFNAYSIPLHVKAIVALLHIRTLIFNYQDKA